ncbi:hypothetical protein ACP275_14G030300 [Erythranthe tilingii]
MNNITNLSSASYAKLILEREREIMNEIREVAKAYYAAATPAEKDLAVWYFRLLDANGDGRISLAEYKTLVSSWFSNDKLFRELDENGDGTLDFEEFLALFYMDKASMRWCDACSNILLGSYFSCLLCEKDYPHSYDLCCRCYGGGGYQHRHPPSSFMDNRSMRLLLAQIMKQSQVTVPDDDEVSLQNSQRSVARSQSTKATAKELFVAFGQGVNIGHAAVHIGSFAVVAGCCIM